MDAVAFGCRRGTGASATSDTFWFDIHSSVGRRYLAIQLIIRQLRNECGKMIRTLRESYQIHLSTDTQGSHSSLKLGVFNLHQEHSDFCLLLDWLTFRLEYVKHSLDYYPRMKRTKGPSHFCSEEVHLGIAPQQRCVDSCYLLHCSGL